VFRSADPALLGLPWELMRDEAGPVALTPAGLSRSMPVAGGAGTLAVPGGRLRVLMVISRPAGIRDVGYQMVARPLLDRLEAVRGNVELVVLRPPTIDTLRQAVADAAAAGKPFHVVHFDGHGHMPDRLAGGAVIAGRPAMMAGAGAEGLLAFEQPNGGSAHVSASKVAAVLAEGRIPVVVLNACQSGALGKELESSVATALLRAGCAAVVAMAYTVYAVAAAEFMAAFYESLFTGTSVGQAVTAGRRRLATYDERPSLKGNMPLADWLVPVHYMRTEVCFPQACTSRPAGALPLDAMLDQIRAAAPASAREQDPLDPADRLFIGRDDLFYELETAARLQHVVVLSGPGGTGKTELAKGFARWWRDTGGVDDPRLMLLHSFESGAAGFGLDGVITGIGLKVFGAEFSRLDERQRLDAVKQLLSRSRVLLVLDNFESVRDMPDAGAMTTPLDEAGCVALKGFLDWVRERSSSAVIITSRTQEDWLGPVRRIHVGGLNHAEAAQYAGYLLAPYPAAQQRRERRSFGELLEWLDGHPLAMRLTLHRLDVTDPAELLAGLQGTSPLPVTDDPDAGRSTSLPASIAYSYAHLSGQARQLLPAVSLFRGIADEHILAGFSAVEGVPDRFARISMQEWTAVLDDAARVGLLARLGAGMYRIHPALPGYLAAGWQAQNPEGYSQERDACQQALCISCAWTSRQLTRQIERDDAASAHVIIGVHRRTLGATLAHALDRRAWDDASGIIRALDAYWDARGLRGEATAWSDRVLAATAGPGQAPPAAAESLWLYTMATHASRRRDAGQPDQAKQIHLDALAYLQDQPETGWTRHSLAVTYHQLGITALIRGQLDEAEDWSRRSLAVFEDLGDWPAMAGSYHQLGVCALDRGRLDEADAWYRQALIIDKEQGNQLGMARSYHQLGISAQERGQLDEAEDWSRRSLAIFEEIGDRRGMAGGYHLLCVTAQEQGQLDEAEEWSRRSLTIEEELCNRTGIASSYHELGMIAHLRGRLDEAEDWYRRSLAIEEELGNRTGMASTFYQLGMIAQGCGRLDEAEDWYCRSLTILQELGDRLHLAMTYGQLGVLAVTQQKPLQALDRVIRCVTLFPEFPHPAAGPGPDNLTWLARQLGMPAVERAWEQVTGQAVPKAVRDYITSQQFDKPGDES
jgi:tetratricopeptide (TPR) repeat protein